MNFDSITYFISSLGGTTVKYQQCRRVNITDKTLLNCKTPYNIKEKKLRTIPTTRMRKLCVT